MDKVKRNMKCKAKNTRKSEAGYTLTELLVVLVIIALLTAIVAPRLIGRVGKAKSTTARTQIENLISALEVYRLDVGQFPSAEQGLGALMIAPDGAVDWSGPYMRRKAIAQDPWKRDYIYALSADQEVAIITSLGRDGKPGGDGEDRDISSEE